MKTLRTLDQVVALAQAAATEGQTVFCRYSVGPAADARSGYRSRDHASGALHAGLSVNALTHLDVAGGTERAWIVQQLAEYAFMSRQGLRGTRCWLMTGTECGRGADNEPLVRDITPLACVSPSVIDAVWSTEQARQDRQTAIRQVRERLGVIAYAALHDDERERLIIVRIDALYGRSA